MEASQGLSWSEQVDEWGFIKTPTARAKGSIIAKLAFSN